MCAYSMASLNAVELPRVRVAAGTKPDPHSSDGQKSRQPLEIAHSPFYCDGGHFLIGSQTGLGQFPKNGPRLRNHSNHCNQNSDKTDADPMASCAISLAVFELQKCLL
jgi:hypothetical protein